MQKKFITNLALLLLLNLLIRPFWILGIDRAVQNAVSVVVPGQGQVLQQIRNQGMFQSARIGGDFNQIHNAITMHIGLNTAAGNAFGGTYAALQGLKSMPQNGMF